MPAPPPALPPQHGRIWWNAGVGAGRSGPAQSGGGDQYDGISGDLAAGAVLTSRGLVGLDAAVWHRNTPIGSSQSTFVSVTFLGYPFLSFLDKLYLQGGLGVGIASFPTVVTTRTPSRLHITEPALQIGLGYDIPVACPLWITPFFQYLNTFGGHSIPQASSKQLGSANAVLLHAGLALKFFRAGPPGACTRRPEISIR